MSKKLTLLWVDLKVSEGDSEPDSLLQDYFVINRCGRDSRIAQQFDNCKPDAVCFDFDYPDRAGLRMVEEIKRLFPSLPMFVTTIQHSEELAVWAFRSRMTDFLVKPIHQDELMRCYGVLQDIFTAKQKQSGRVMAKSEQVMPASAVSTVKSTENSLEPAIYYIEQNFRRKIKAEEVAKLCGMSSFRFSRSFKETYRIAFRDYVVRYRLREAYNMLKTGHVTVTEASFAVGFNDVAYFSRMFKRFFEVCPSSLNSASSKNTKAVEDSPSMTLRLPLPLH